MQYTPEQIETIGKMARIFMKPSSIADYLQINVEEFQMDLQDRSTEVSQVYHYHKAASELEIKAREMEMARLGSPMGIENVNRNLLDMTEDE